MSIESYWVRTQHEGPGSNLDQCFFSFLSELLVIMAFLGDFVFQKLQNKHNLPLRQIAGRPSVQVGSARIGNWRVFFEFIDGDAYIVDYDDYH